VARSDLILTHLENSDKFRLEHGRMAIPVEIRTLIAVIGLCVGILLTSCSLPQVSAANRMFLDLSLEFVGEYELPESQRLSDLTYEITGYGEPTDGGIRFYGLGESEGESDPTELYTLGWEFAGGNKSADIAKIGIKESIKLSDRPREARSIAFSPRKSLFIATDNSHIGEYDLETGELKNTVPLPPSYVLKEDETKPPQGLQPELGIKSLAIAPDGFSAGGMDPFRLFVAPYASLKQDLDSGAGKVRILHYVIADRASFLVSENLYNFDEDAQGRELAGLVALNRGGSFLSLERSASGMGAGIYQVFSGDATDTSRIASLRGKLTKVQSLRKQLLLNLPELGINAQVTGMTLGPRLPDGGQSLVVIRDNPPGLLIFRLTGI